MTRYLGIFSFVLFLVSCSGGGSSSSNSSSSMAITGTAATGAPITNSMNGVVTLKDSSSPAKTAVTATDGNGNYSFTKAQIQGYVAPFMIEVNYTIGGTQYYLNSAVTAQDLTSGTATINVTPLTDLVISNIAGQIAQNVFNNGNFATLLTPTALSNGVQSLDVLLQPVLTQLGLSATLDLLHSSFNANGTGLDGLLDSVNVSVDPTTKAEVITNTLNGASITGTLTAPPTTPLSTANTTSATLTDLQAITNVFTNFATLMATNPTATNTFPSCIFDQTNFFDQGQNLSAFLQNVVSNTTIAGGTLAFNNIALKSIPSWASIPSGATASYDVSFTVLINKSPNSQHDFVIYKNASGTWLILGDQLRAKLDISAFEGDNNGVMCTGIQLNIQDKGGLSPSISYATVTGPGLPTATSVWAPTGGVLLYQAGNGQSFNLSSGIIYNGTNTQQPSNSNCYNDNVYITNDATIATIASSLPAVYTITLYYVSNGANAPTTKLVTYTQTIAAAPLTSAQLTTSVFPTNIRSSASMLTAAESTPTGTVTISWTAPTTQSEYANDLAIEVSNNSNGGGQVFYNLTPTQTSQLVTPPSLSSTSGAGDSVTVEYNDAVFRTIWASPAGSL